MKLGIIQEMLLGTFVAICFRSPFQSHDICSIAFEVICIKNLANWFAAKISASIFFEFVAVLISQIAILFKSLVINSFLEYKRDKMDLDELLRGTVQIQVLL